MRDGKGTYWVCIGKNKYRKLFTGDWFQNQKHGQGIYFYKDGSCYDGTWKNSKREGKGLMIYANGDVYEGSWENDLKHGYGILEKKGGDKYYGYWNEGLKEGQGYYYYYQKGKIYMGEWHEDAPRCGVYTDVDDENMKKEFKKHFRALNPDAQIPALKLQNPEGLLEECIDSVHFIRNVKIVKNKNVHELFGAEFQADLILFFIKKQNENELEKEEGIRSFQASKGSDNYVLLQEFRFICLEKLGIEVKGKLLINFFYFKIFVCFMIFKIINFII